MKWSRRLAQIEASRARTPKWRAPFPDLSCPSTCAPTSDVIAVPGSNTELNRRPALTIPLLVGTLHKQGPQVLAKADLPFAGGRKV